MFRLCFKSFIIFLGLRTPCRDLGALCRDLCTLCLLTFDEFCLAVDACDLPHLKPVTLCLKYSAAGRAFADLPLASFLHFGAVPRAPAVQRPLGSVLVAAQRCCYPSVALQFVEIPVFPESLENRAECPNRKVKGYSEDMMAFWFGNWGWSSPRCPEYITLECRCLSRAAARRMGVHNTRLP